MRDRRYPKEVVTLGDHLKVKRLDAGLKQDDVARMLGVAGETLLNWETGATEPAVRFYPQIASFLGYCLWTPQATLGGRLRQARTYQGLSAAALAAKLSADEATVALWEADEGVPAAHHRLNLALFLGVRLDP